MNADLGTIPEPELDLLNCAVRICEPTEKDGQGVLVTCIDGVRTWQVSEREYSITIRGDQQNFTGTYIVPGRLIKGAASFGDMDHSCNISIKDNFAIATSPSGSSMRLATALKVPEFRTFGQKNVVQARVEYRDLQRMSSLLGDAPMNYHDFETMWAQPPVGHIDVTKNLITLKRSWQYVGCPDTELTLAAKTTKTGSFSFNHIHFDMVLSLLWSIGEGTATIGFDPENGEYLEVHTDKVSVHFKMMLDGAAQFFPQVKEYLTSRNIEHLVHDGGQIAVKYKDIKVRLQLFDGSEPILRSTVTVLHNVTESVKLLREINRLNATRVGNRIWVDNKMLVVGSEMRCDETKMLTPILDGLVNEARYLGGLLGPLYGGTTPAAA